jgi:phosphoribosylformylglycinamidine synthase
VRVYDHEVQGGTVVKPLTGVEDDGPSDACVLKPVGTRDKRGIVLSNGINPNYGKVDAYRMALSVVDEAIRNAVAVGSDPERIALLDNFCWGDPRRPETLGDLVEAARGCYDAASTIAPPLSEAGFAQQRVRWTGRTAACHPTHAADLSSWHHRGCSPGSNDGPEGIR